MTELCCKDRVASHPSLLALEELERQSKGSLTRDDYVIFGSGSMMAHGIRDDISDLDIVARRNSWRWARRFGEPVVDAVSGESLARFQVAGFEIDVGPGWFSGELWTPDHIIDSADVVAGFRFTKLAYVREYKFALGRRKDLADIAAIDDYLTDRQSER